VEDDVQDQTIVGGVTVVAVAPEVTGADMELNVPLQDRSGAEQRFRREALTLPEYGEISLTEGGKGKMGNGKGERSKGAHAAILHGSV
jgi:hypothetical protein